MFEEIIEKKGITEKENEKLKEIIKDMEEQMNDLWNMKIPDIEENTRGEFVITFVPAKDRENVEFIGERIYNKINEVQDIMNENNKIINDLRQYLRQTNRKTEACEKYLTELTQNFIKQNDKQNDELKKIKKKKLTGLEEEELEENEYSDIETNRAIWNILKDNYSFAQQTLTREIKIQGDKISMQKEALKDYKSLKEWRIIAKDIIRDIESYDEDIYGKIIDKTNPINIRVFWRKFKKEFLDKNYKQEEQVKEDCNLKWIVTCRYIQALQNCYCNNIQEN
jgi:hypothetical protein